jgi:hypothetical protein
MLAPLSPTAARCRRLGRLAVIIAGHARDTRGRQDRRAHQRILRLGTGVPIAEVLLRATSVGVVLVVRLGDGRRVVVRLISPASRWRACRLCMTFSPSCLERECRVRSRWCLRDCLGWVSRRRRH